jgi:Ca2+-binding RTX toxin-like protein
MRRNAILGVLVGALLLVLMSGVALAATERGTRGDDLLVGTERDDRLVGRNGDDRLKALEGNDTLRGGNGNDELLARDGEKDRLECGGGSRDRYAADSFDVVSGDCEKEAEYLYIN